MSNFEELVKARRSVRTFDERPLSEADRAAITEFIKNIPNPYGVPVEVRLLTGMSSPVVVGTDLFAAAKLKKGTCANEAFGYSFQKLVMFAQSLGIGTVWIGGTMDRGSFEKKMELADDEFMPCVSPLGYPAKKMSLRETMMRKGVKADDRLAFEQIVFKNSFAESASAADAGKLAPAFEMVRLAPSAVNKQPWRMLICGDTVHFYLQRSKGFPAGTLDMQKIDMGIALCNFDMMAQELGLSTEFAVSDPKADGAEGMEYIASYTVK